MNERFTHDVPPELPHALGHGNRKTALASCGQRVLVVSDSNEPTCPTCKEIVDERNS